MSEKYKNGGHPNGDYPMETFSGEDDDRTTDFTSDENKDRGNWSGRMDFLLSCLGYAVGLGNVWRFPYLCYKNGGAAFFIPYCIMLGIVGIPIFFLELSLGQFTSRGIFNCWQFAPMFKGIGVAMFIVSLLVGIYYNMIVGWSIYYLCASFTSKLPWSECGDWSSEWCSENVKDLNATQCVAPLTYNDTTTVCYNGSTVYGVVDTTVAETFGMKKIIPSEDYMNRAVLGTAFSEGIHDLGPLNWRLCLCLLGAWLIVFFSLIKGIKSSGKVVYFTALFPYVVLIILLGWGLTLDGYFDGIRFYILEADLNKLKEAQVWKDAAVQIFFSLSASWGGLITLASYNRFHNDCLRDSLIVSIGNCLTSFFAGFVIFSYLGFLAKELGTTVAKVATSGPGLAFVVYPDAVTRMPVSPLWAILFFIMLITLGLDSQFAMLETLTTAVIDQWPDALRKRKSFVIGGFSLIMFGLGLPMCTNGGIYILELMDTYSGGWNVLIIALAECISIAWIYGFTRFREDIRTMIGNFGCNCFPWTCCSFWWIGCWAILTPLGVLFILFFSWIEYKPITSGDYIYPVWAEAIGWCMTLSVVLGLFVTMFVMFCITPGSFMERMSYLTNPTREWGPALVQHRRKIKHVPGFVVDPSSDSTPYDDQYPNKEFGGSYPATNYNDIQVDVDNGVTNTAYEP
ncbi:unnamed protein product [Owenia fusiformis]|uniref:Transporter n=1 Tax=Owenia fusiformis TaxID=6347 RepID=A0A8S4NJK0_OWEFU|nr:unnamed protein product [Owenia fusiformis]